MITAALLLAVGAVDLARGLRSVLAGWIAVVLAGAAVATLLGLAGAPLALVLGVLAVALAWTLAAEGPRARRIPALATVAVLLVVAGAAVLADAIAPVALAPGAPLATVWASGSGLPLESALLVLGAALVLVRTANLVVRSTLVQAIDRDRLAGIAPAAAPHPAGWHIRLGGRAVGSLEQVSASRTPSVLRGGRIIGPLERGFVVVLAVLGAWAAIGALVAAKGIVRFPEISGDRSSGSKAEEFLIGSLTSWAVAGALAILLATRLG